MLLLDVLSRIVHVGTAITLVGGSLFMLLVLMPSAKQLADEPHDQLATEVQSRWKKFVHFGVLLFLVSGFYNYWRAMPSHQGDGLYHALVGTKMLLAFGVFFLASALIGRSEKLKAFREQRGKWLSVMLLLAAVIVGISGFVKVALPPTGSGVSADNPANE